MPKYRPQSEIDQSQKDYKLVLEYFKGDLQKASDYFVELDDGGDMSIQYCEQCGLHIDTDFNSEHFGDDVGGCERTFECSMSPECPCDDCQRENVKKD